MPVYVSKAGGVGLANVLTVEDLDSSWITGALTTDTGSFIVSASFGSPFVTFSFGDGSQQYVDLSSLQPSTASYALSASFTQTASYVNLLAGPNITINYQPNGIAITGSAGGGTPSPPEKGIQYNSGSQFAATASFIFDYQLQSFGQGSGVKPSGSFSHAQGQDTVATGSYSHAEGNGTRAEGAHSHAEGLAGIAQGEYSHAEGAGKLITSAPLTAIGVASHAEGIETTAYGTGSHAEGWLTLASGSHSHAEGYQTEAVGAYSHAEGKGTLAYGTGSHAEGNSTQASGSYAHAEGNDTRAQNSYAHAEGDRTQALGNSSHAEGGSSIAQGRYSHAEGNATLARGDFSNAKGLGTIAHADGQLAVGQYNIDANAVDLFVIGNGTDASNRSDVFNVSLTSVNVTGSNNITGSVNVVGNQTITGSLFVRGNVTAQQYIISSSVIYVTESNFSGSHVFGNTLDDTHQFTGSVFVTGSATFIGPLNANNVFLTGSLFGTSSWSIQALTASFVTSSNVYGPFSANSILSASHGVTASYIDGGTF